MSTALPTALPTTLPTALPTTLPTHLYEFPGLYPATCVPRTLARSAVGCVRWHPSAVGAHLFEGAHLLLIEILQKKRKGVTGGVTNRRNRTRDRTSQQKV